MKRKVLLLICSVAVLGVQNLSAASPYEKLDKIQYKDDFYLAANKDWIQAKLKENPNRIYYNSYSGVYDTIDNHFIDILENQKPQDKYEELVFNAYQSAFDIEKRNAVGIEPVRKYIEQFNKAKSVQELLDIEDNLFKETGMTVLLCISRDQRIAAAYYMNVLPAVKNVDLNNPAVTKLVRDYIINLAKIIYGSNSNIDFAAYADSVLAFEKKIQSVRQEHDFQETPYLSTINQLLPQVDLNNLLEQRDMSPVGFMYVPSMAGQKQRMELLFSADLDVLKKHIELCLLSFYADRFSYDLEELNAKFWADFYNEALPSKEKIIKSNVINRLKVNAYPIMEQLYLKYVFTDEVKNEIEEIAENVRESYLELIEASQVFNEKNKNIARHRVKGLEINFGGTKHELGFYEIVAADDTSSYCHNMFALDVAYRKYFKKGNNLGYTRFENAHDVYMYNAFWLSTGELFLLAGYFVEPIYSKNYSIEYKYGTVGSVVGHEMSHSFGLNFAGNKEYRKNLVDLFDGYKEVCGTKNDGNKISNEAIADILGMQAALTALKKEKADANLKDFFTGYAYTHREIMTKYGEEYYLKTDTHPLPRARTNCCVVNFPEFYEAFGIKKGDKMYVAPQKRVKLW